MEKKVEDSQENWLNQFIDSNVPLFHFDDSFIQEFNEEKAEQTLYFPQGVQFKCDLCPRTFRNRKSLNRHVREIHEKMSFRCMNCSKTFLRRHLIADHDLRCNGGSSKRMLETEDDEMENKRKKIEEQIDYEVRTCSFLMKHFIINQLTKVCLSLPHVYCLK